MRKDDPLIDELMRAALAAEREQRWADASERYARVVAHAPDWPLAYLCLGCALGRLGRPDEAAQVLSLGNDLSQRVLGAWRSPDTEPDVAARSKYADRLLRHVLTAMHTASVRRYEDEAGCGPLPRVRSAIWCQTHDRPFRYRHAEQRPWLLYLPELAPVPWFDAADLPWAEALMQRYPAIRGEVLTAVADLAAEARPYVPADAPSSPDLAAVHGSDRWSSIHLYREGVPAAGHVLRAFPETRAALAQVDCVRLHGHPMEVVVSILAPGAVIPPHFGLANTRLTVHLPVSVPDDCWLTVAGESRTPREGELLAFDDGFLHEAGNGSERRRIHLIFEAWRPDLDRHETAALSRCIEDRGQWNRTRQVPQAAGGPAAGSTGVARA